MEKNKSKSCTSCEQDDTILKNATEEEECVEECTDCHTDSCNE